MTPRANVARIATEEQALKTPIEYHEDVLRVCGGALRLALYLNVHQLTVENWRRCGIPQKYWNKIESKWNITPAELHHVWLNCRRRAIA